MKKFILSLTILFSFINRFLFTFVFYKKKRHWYTVLIHTGRKKTSAKCMHELHAAACNPYIWLACKNWPNLITVGLEQTIWLNRSSASCHGYS